MGWLPTATYLYTGPAEAGTLQILDLLGRVVRTAQVDGRAQGEVPLACPYPKLLKSAGQ